MWHRSIRAVTVMLSTLVCWTICKRVSAMMPFISAGMAGLLSYVPAQGDDAGGKLGPSAAGKNDLLKSIAFHCRAVKARWGRMPYPGRTCRAGRRRGPEGADFSWVKPEFNVGHSDPAPIRLPCQAGRGADFAAWGRGRHSCGALWGGTPGRWAVCAGLGLFGGRSGQNAGRSGPAGEWRDREGNPGDGFRGAGPADRAGPRPFFKNIPLERQNVLRLLYRNTAKTGWKRKKTA